MKRTISILISLSVATISQAVFANGTIGPVVVNGSGCRAGTYEAVMNPDGSEISIHFKAFTAKTKPGRSIDFVNCNVAVPVHVPQGLTVALVGVDYRGHASIPAGGRGTLRREHFFAGQQGLHKTDSLNGVYHDEFLFNDSVTGVQSSCGGGGIVRSSATILVTKKNGSSADEAMMSITSENANANIVFHLQWKTC